MTPLFWYGVAAGVGTVVAALMLAALVSRLFREPAAHRAGIGEDEDDPDDFVGPGTGYTEPEQPVRIHPNLYPRGVNADWTPQSPSASLGPPPTYPETPEEHTR
jgi:hypothetical protein